MEEREKERGKNTRISVFRSATMVEVDWLLPARCSRGTHTYTRNMLEALERVGLMGAVKRPGARTPAPSTRRNTTAAFHIPDFVQNGRFSARVPVCVYPSEYTPRDLFYVWERVSRTYAYGRSVKPRFHRTLDLRMIERESFLFFFYIETSGRNEREVDLEMHLNDQGFILFSR